MPQKTPSLRDWQHLYAAAIEFKEIASWNWMYDSDVFGVQNPETGEIGYCCILGNLGEVFALILYLGTEGLSGYLKVQSGESSPESADLIHSQKCLMASFDDRKDLEKADLQVIKELGLKFRGRRAWPLFRSYLPGYLPWFLTQKEARFLTSALEQATQVSLRRKENPKLLVPPKKNRYLVRVPEGAGKNQVWKDTWSKPASLPSKDETAPAALDEVRLQRIKKKIAPHENIWEADFFHAPFVVEDGGRPFFPYIFLLVDQNSGHILSFQVSDFDCYQTEFREKLVGAIEETNLLPRELWVRSEDAFKLLESTAKELRIRLALVEKLDILEEAQDSLMDYFSE